MESPLKSMDKSVSKTVEMEVSYSQASESFEEDDYSEPGEEVVKDDATKKSKKDKQSLIMKRLHKEYKQNQPSVEDSSDSKKEDDAEDNAPGDDGEKGQPEEHVKPSEESKDKLEEEKPNEEVN